MLLHVGKAERIWEAADLLTLPYLAVQQHRATGVDPRLSSHHM